jgi:hypothetical protein
LYARFHRAPVRSIDVGQVGVIAAVDSIVRGGEEVARDEWRVARTESTWEVEAKVENGKWKVGWRFLIEGR